MRVVIIGGGIAGLAAALYCKKNNMQYSVYERAKSFSNKGHAFLMHTDGVNILNEITTQDAYLPGNFVSRFHLMQPNGITESEVNLDLWQCVKRTDLVDLLFSELNKDTVHFGKEFSHFEYQNSTATAAVFKDGSIAKGDLFIGADGANSFVRNAIFGTTNFTPTESKEVLGIAQSPPIAKKFKGVFTKYQSKTEGIAFGFIPFSDSELIWFMQYDCRKNDISAEDNHIEVEQFTKNQLRNFPKTVQSLIEHTNFNQSYVWHTKDFDPLDTYHKNNVVLMGDAAHLALPFTSAGTTNALRDAKELIHSIIQNTTIEEAFDQYKSKRSSSVNAHLFMGRELKEAFLNPVDKAYSIPLIDSADSNVIPEIKIVHYTDPLCSTCWAIEPHLQKFKFLYSKYYKSEYVMGGLLKKWPLETGSIKTPSDVIPYWEKTAQKSGMPLNTSVWKKNPIQSSYPACIAFKAAQNYSLAAAKKYLRRLRELLFIDGEQIDNQLVIDLCLQYAGISIDDYEIHLNEAEEQFQKDLITCKEHNISSLPTIEIYVNSALAYRFEGEITFSKLENALVKISPNIPRKPAFVPVDTLLKMQHSFTLTEFSNFTGLLREDALLTLNALVIKRRLIEHRNHEIAIWYVV